MSSMRITSVNLGTAKDLSHRGKDFVTGIDKQATAAAVYVAADGLRGDAVCDEEHHGGPDQAVYAYSADDYDWWSETLGRPIAPGTFGDNLTIAGLPSDMSIGDRLLIGDVVLEATAPRIPCSTLAAQMQDSNFGLAFRRAERPGIYFRVLNEGEIASGDAVTYVPDPDNSVTVLDLYRFAFASRPEKATMEALLASPLAERMRRQVEAKLATADTHPEAPQPT